MFGKKKQSLERFYLDRKEDEVYIDTFPLPQHQIDGIRFMYTQFKKKKQGIILNSPPGFGKSLQVALFLSAIKKLLTKPALILCNSEREIENWAKTFQTSTEYSEDDIAINSANIFVKKLIFLQRAENLAPFSRRDWGVVIVKNDSTPKDLLAVPLSANYKIWITSVNVCKDVQMLNSVYGWLYSKKKFDIQSLIISDMNCKGELGKLIFLDAFLEDVVIQRNECNMPSKKNKALLANELESQPKVSRKNKDATGTKIKRSKKKLNEDDNFPNINNGNEHVIKKGLNKKIQNDCGKSYIIDIDLEEKDKDFSIDNFMNETNSKDKESDEMDVETFIRTHKRIEFEELEFIKLTNTKEFNGDEISFQNTITKIDNSNTKDFIDDEISCQHSITAIENNSNRTDLNIEDISFQVTINENQNNENNRQNKTKNDNNEFIPDHTSDVLENANNKKVEETTELKNVNKTDELEVDNNKNCVAKSDIAKTSKRGIDEKLTEMEDKILKKFRGSILDNLI